MVVNSFPMHGVRAMGWKLPGVVGSSPAKLFPISVMAATFHWKGTADKVQQELKGPHRALNKDGHLLKIRYVIRSNDDSDEEDFILLTAACISTAVISSQQNSSSGGNGDGILSGWERSWASAWYTSLKKLKVSFSENWRGIWEVELSSSSCFANHQKWQWQYCLVLFAWLRCWADCKAHFRWLCSCTSLKNVRANIWILSIGSPCSLALLKSFLASFFSCLALFRALSCRSLFFGCLGILGFLVPYFWAKKP